MTVQKRIERIWVGLVEAGIKLFDPPIIIPPKLKAKNGVKTKIDVVSKTELGTIKLREAKASETATLTKKCTHEF